jgi:putative transposase
MDKITHEVRTQEWAGIIQACNTSGQSKKEWCEENGVSIRKFFYWQKKLRAELYAERAKTVGIVRTSQMKATELAPAFAEVPTTPAPANTGSPFQPDAVITVGGVSIQLSNTATKELLDRISGALSHAV